MIKVILASKSPRRSEILNNLKVNFETLTPNIDESSEIKDPALLVETLSQRKANAVFNNLSSSKDTLIIAADTVVFLDNEILGKPKNDLEAKNMLSKLSGKTHTVISGLCLMFNGNFICGHACSKVTFDKLSEKDIEFYVKSGEPLDKAGAYGIQGLGAIWVSGIKGCYFNVMGLPVNLLKNLLKELGLNLYEL